MAEDRKGKLILKPVKDEQSEKRVVSYLIKFMKNTSPGKLTEMMRKGPLILSGNISAVQAQKIMTGLEKIGGTAVFKPHAPAAPKADPPQNELPPEIPPLPKIEPALKPPPGPAVPPKKGRGKTIRIAVLSLLLFLTLCLAGWRFYPLLSYRADELVLSKIPRLPIKEFDFEAWQPLEVRSPSIMETAPEKMRTAMHYQYRLRPDMRFIRAFEVLVRLTGELEGMPKKGAYRLGEVLSNGKEVLVPLLKDGRAASEIRISLPMTFSGGMDALGELLSVMVPPTPDVREETTAGGGSFERDLAEAEASIDMVDPRDIIYGLTRLEDLWQNGGSKPKLLRGAVRGYNMLLMVLIPDRMRYGDDLAGYALSFLALARHLDPKTSLADEEALLAMNMKYTAHASKVIQAHSEAAGDPVTQITAAYTSRNIEALKSLDAKGSSVLGRFLLGRLYRELWLHREAEQVALDLLEKYPNHYPSAVEIIYSGDIGIAKQLTRLYPQDIMTYVEGEVRPRIVTEITSRLRRLKASLGTPDVTSLSEFESLLKKGRPLDYPKGRGIVIDRERVKTVFRILYADALFLRFHLLMDRWSVQDLALEYATALAEDDENHPLVMEMLADIHADIGDLDRADAVLVQLIEHPDTPWPLAMGAWNQLAERYKVNEQLRLAPAVAHKLDGRPNGLLFMAELLRGLCHFDLAEKFNTLGLSRDPQKFQAYTNLAVTTGDDEQLLKALAQYPDSFNFMEKAADYFNTRGDPDSLEKAVKYYGRALNVVPTRDTLHMRKAKALNKLGRHEQAAGILESWIERYSGGDLTTVVVKARLAETYLKMKNPDKALNTIADEVESYQGSAMTAAAEAYKEQGNLDKAEELFLRAVERYPSAGHILSKTAAFYWDQGRNDEAAQIIAQGRASQGEYSPWYFNYFMKVFATAPKNRILSAVSKLLANGAGSWEIHHLGQEFNPDRPEITYRIIEWAPVTYPMQQLEKNVELHKVLKAWKGEREALNYLRKSVNKKMKRPMIMALFKQGLFEVILSEYPDPDSYSSRQREFMWLLRLMSWLALDKKPSDLENTFADHYRKSSSDYYHAVGRYLMGYMPENELLKRMKTDKQRCEFAYYIGFNQRIKGNFALAADWYHICRDTLLRDNGEFYWASTELSWWTHMGTKHRHRLLSDDIQAYYTAQAKKIRDY